MLCKSEPPRIEKMTPTELIADSLIGNFNMLRMTLTDFSDADMLVRPVTAANHALWQLGHLVIAEWHLLEASGVKGVIPPPPEAWLAKFSKETSRIDDASFFPNKSTLLEALENSRKASAAWARTLTETQLNQPITGSIGNFAPNLGRLAIALGDHTAMHVGQFQVIRRALGKPVLF